MAGTRGFLDPLPSPLFLLPSPLNRSESSAVADLLPAGENLFRESPEAGQYGVAAGRLASGVGRRPAAGGRARFRSRASLPTYRLSRRTTLTGWRRALCPSCS